jgi:hypothetical protein
LSPLKVSPVSFSRQLAPILADKCLTCHQEKKAKGRYRVDTFEQLLKAGDSGDKPVVASEPGASLLYFRLVTHDEDERMPQKDDPLPAAQVTQDACLTWRKETSCWRRTFPRAGQSNRALAVNLHTRQHGSAA